MIKKLQNSNEEVAQEIRSVFQLSYRVEADLLGATDFPPLRRPLERFVHTETQFFGYLKNDRLAGVVEIEFKKELIDINSLVVHPDFFRQGVGRALMEYALSNFDAQLFVVETGLDNVPAIALYKVLGFQEVEQWDTDFGIRKIKLEHRING